MKIKETFSGDSDKFRILEQFHDEEQEPLRKEDKAIE
jgi:hypothetical protein